MSSIKLNDATLARLSSTNTTDEIVTALFKCAEECVIKSNSEAEATENTDSRNTYDAYRISFYELDEVTDYTYTDAEYNSAGLTNIEINHIANGEWFSVPEVKKEALLNLRRVSIVDQYKELNTYYLTLAGKPSPGDPTFTVSQLGYYPTMDNTKMVHDCNESEINVFMSDGSLHDLKLDYPNVKYLNYLHRRTDSIHARESNDYSLLYLPAIDTDLEYVRTHFSDNYVMMQNYFRRTFYNKFYETSYTFYRNTMQMYVIMGALIMSMRSTILSHIDGDAIDELSIEKIMRSKGMDYYSSMPRNIKLNIVKNMNNLIANRGAKQVIVDIQKIFGIDGVYRYVLYKRPLAGDPTNKQLVFVKVPLDEANPLPYLKDFQSHVPYNEAIIDDPHWDNSQATYDAHMAKQFNYVNTKYISLENMINITDFTYEISFFLRSAMLQKDNHYFKIFFRSYGADVSLFDIVIYCLALICHKYDYKGEIPDTIDSELSVVAFNYPPEFNDLLTEFKQVYNNNPLLDSFSVGNQYTTTSNYAKSFNNNLGIIKRLDAMLADVTEYSEIILLRKIRTMLGYSKVVEQIFEKPDGSVANTYEDLCMSSELGTRYTSVITMTEEQVNDEINNIILSLEQSLADMNKGNLFNGLFISENINVFATILGNIVDFFKSYRVQLKEFEAIFVVSDPATERLSLYDDLLVEVELMDSSLWAFDDNLDFTVELSNMDPDNVNVASFAMDDREEINKIYNNHMYRGSYVTN